MNDCNKPVESVYLGDIPVDTLDALPSYMLAERDVTDPNTNKVIRSITRIPAAKLFGGGTMDNVATIEPNNTITVPENQVLAGRIVNNGSYNTVELTTATNEPDFLIIGNLADQLLIQSTGFVYFPEGHQYIVGQQYYSGENGMPTTNDASGHKLFKAISSTKLVVNLG